MSRAALCPECGVAWRYSSKKPRRFAELGDLCPTHYHKATKPLVQAESRLRHPEVRRPRGATATAPSTTKRAERQRAPWLVGPNPSLYEGKRTPDPGTLRRWYPSDPIGAGRGTHMAVKVQPPVGRHIARHAPCL